MLARPLTGTGLTVDEVLAATEYVVPALEILSSRIELEGRTIVDTISDNAAMGAMVLGDTPHRPGRGRPALGVRHPAPQRRRSRSRASRPPCSATRPPASPGSPASSRSTAHRSPPGETILAGSFTRPIWIERGDDLLADYKELGTIACRFA